MTAIFFDVANDCGSYAAVHCGANRGGHLDHGHFIALRRQIFCRFQTGQAAADHCDLLTGKLHIFGKNLLVRNSLFNPRNRRANLCAASGNNRTDSADRFGCLYSAGRVQADFNTKILCFKLQSVNKLADHLLAGRLRS